MSFTRILFLGLCIRCPEGSAQNLVLNSSFEDTITSSYDQIYPLCKHWNNPNGASADYFTPYWEELCCNPGNILGVPNTGYFGYQNAEDGVAFLGLDIYESTGETKEYAQGFLSSALVPEQDYCIGIWINLADSSGFHSCDFQVSFTTELVYNEIYAGSLDLPNQVELDISETDTADWHHFTGVYHAIGGEQYLYLGSNKSNEELLCAEPINISGQFANIAYVFVDNVSVSIMDNCVSTQFDSETCHTWFSNPVQSWMKMGFCSAEKRRLVFYNALGEIISEQITTESEVKLDMRAFRDGVYYLISSESEATQTYKIQKITD